jgi:hypothetical protein
MMNDPYRYAEPVPPKPKTLGAYTNEGQMHKWSAYGFFLASGCWGFNVLLFLLSKVNVTKFTLALIICLLYLGSGVLSWRKAEKHREKT